MERKMEILRFPTFLLCLEKQVWEIFRSQNGYHEIFRSQNGYTLKIRILGGQDWIEDFSDFPIFEYCI